MEIAASRLDSRVFISYRREDAGYAAGWLFDHLAARFGADRVFKYVNSIKPGDDFAAAITDAAGSCTVLLAVIGSRWLTLADMDGRRCVDDPADWARLEIEAALARGVRLTPVLVDGALMPLPEQLPASLGGLTRRQAVELSHARFSSDIARLTQVLDPLLSAEPAAARSRSTAPTTPQDPAARAGGIHHLLPG
jgi:TIR domain